MTQQKLTKARKEEIKAKMATNPILMGRICMPAMYTLPTPACHYEWQDDYMNPQVKKAVYVSPRETAKSSVFGCVFPIHHQQFDEGPKVVLLTSKTQQHSINLLQTIKDVYDYSMPFRDFFGYWGRHSARLWRNDMVILKDGTAYVCRGTGQMVIGLKIGHQRPTLEIVDDPEDLNNTKTAEAMEYNLKWLLQSMVPGLDAKRGRLFVIGTPQHERCMVETLFDLPDWLSRRYRSQQDDGTAIWPEKYSWDELEAKKQALSAINRSSFYYREYQCQVLSDEEQLFKEEYLQEYEGHVEVEEHTGTATLYLKSRGEEAWDEPLAVPVNLFMGVDPATSVLAGRDYFVIMTVAVDAYNNRYILPYVRKRMPPSESIKRILTEYNRWKPLTTSIETTQAQETFRDILRNMEEVYIPGLHLKHTPMEKKSKRYLEVLEPWFYKRKVYMLKNMTALKDELLIFDKGKHDDLIDGMYYAFKRAYKPYQAEVDEDYYNPLGEVEEELDWMVL